MKPAEVLKGLTDAELYEVYIYIKEQIEKKKVQRSMDIWESLEAGAQVKVVRNGDVLWRGKVISKRRTKVLVEKEGGKRYVVPTQMIELA